MVTVPETARRAVKSTLSLAPIDLVLVLTYVAVATAAVGPDPEASAGQFLVGVGLVLFAPGYAVVAALFPGRPHRRDDRPPASVLALTRPHDGLLVRERLALSFGVSVLLVPIVAVVLGAVGITLTTASTLGAVWAIVGGGAVVGTVRRFALPESERFDLVSAAQGVTRRPLSDDSTTTLLTLGLCCLVVVSLGSFTMAIAGPGQSMSYTSASLLSPGESGDLVASDYPANVSRGDSVPLAVRVTNHHDVPANYTVVARLQRVENGTAVGGERVWRGRQRLGVNETWTRNHTVRPTIAGDDLRLTYFVYRGAVSETVSRETADKVLYLRLDVLTGGQTVTRTPNGTPTAPQSPAGPS